ncbi:DUF2529 family protein [Bacillus massiliigorillae]|uniref:DUF2529 family protein n=1 Tax=Bacillus massiliigorillae TaxID=1243664 RepID=UPI0003A98668|nr:DUF2529 family protein [Bacillus massiliigorillae]
MLKIFTTQLNGIFKSISDDEFTIEDAARLLAQAAISDGNIYIHGFKDMQGVLFQALEGDEAIPHCKPLYVNDELAKLSPVDRIILVSHHSHDEDALSLAHQLAQDYIPFIALSSIVDDEKEGLQNLADVHINLKLKRGLVPTETGERVGFPSLIVALYSLYTINLTLKELLEELD